MRRALAVMAAVVAFTACGGSSKKSTGPHVATVIPDEQGLTSFLQCIPRTDTGSSDDYDMFPGCANVWDLSGDFSINDGGNDQWDDALELYVGTLPTQEATLETVSSEYDDLDYYDSVSYLDLTWLTPKLAAADLPTVVVGDGTTTDVPAIEGDSAYIPPGSGTALRQTLTLTSVTPITFSMDDLISPDGSSFTDGPEPLFAVRLLDGAGEELAALREVTGAADDDDWTADLSAYAGQTVTLSFEFASDVGDWQLDAAVVDNVSVLDDDGTQLVDNGGFEDGLTGWTVTKTGEARGIKGPAQTLAGLTVTRSFYALPGSIWARYADEFVNETETEITTQAVYYSDLGSDGAGIIYEPAGVPGALTSWDSSGGDRDVGVVFGSGQVYYLSAIYDDTEGNGTFFIVHDLTVPAGGRVTLVTYVLQGGGDTGQTATDGTAKSTEIDDAAAAIVDGFATSSTYRDYMTQAQLDTVANF